jgi:hypothetical protein
MTSYQERIRSEFPGLYSSSLARVIQAETVPEDYLRVLLLDADEFFDTMVIALVAPQCAAAGVPAEYLRDTWRLPFSGGQDDGMPERLIELYAAGVPREYASQLSHPRRDVGDIISAWSAGLAPEYAEELWRAVG